MRQLSTLFGPTEEHIQKFLHRRSQKTGKWWTPVWRGLVADPDSKHRKEMGASLWLYLYLLTYANRKTGIARRRLDQIQSDTGYPIRTIQRHLKHLIEKNYISLDRSHRYLHIRIKKWKAFNIQNENSH